MDILEFAECFPDNAGEPIFTIVIYQENDQIFAARTSDRCTRITEIRPERLENIVPIPKSAFQPQYSDKLVQAESFDQLHIKRPSLISYYPIENDRIAQGLLREAQVCEILKLHPHSTIAECFGCEVENGRISGLCFTKYKESLMQRLNPGSLGKRAFAESQHLNYEWCSNIIERVNKGLDHLHALGLVHNDLNPSNIMLDDGDAPKLIDFGSCRPIGASLEGVGRTYEWYDEKTHIASKSNDLDALAEISAWMNGKVGDLKFDE